MSIALFVIGFATFTLLVFGVSPVKSEHVRFPRAEADTQAVEISAGPTPPGQPEWHTATVGSLTAAGELLDSLEARGFAEREFVVLGDASFLVRWR